MDPVTVATTAISLTKNATEIANRLFAIWKDVKDRHAKQLLDGILDSLTLLKHSASALEDENRALKREVEETKQKLQLVGEVERKNDFIYHKGQSEPCCPRCFDVDKILVRIVEIFVPKTGRNPACPECKTLFFNSPEGLRGRVIS